MATDATDLPRRDPTPPPTSPPPATPPPAAATPEERGGLDGYFKLTERGTTVGTEIKAGVATFMVMSYILFLNPSILSNMFIPQGDAAVTAFLAPAAAATALVAGVLCIAMGLVSNYPLAMAAGLGINGAVAFGLVLGAGLSPAGAMGVIVLEGLVVLILVLVGLREAIMHAVPLSLKRAIGVGIGLFILFIGLVDAGVIIRPEAGPVPVAFVFPSNAALGVFFFGLLVTIVLFVRRIPGALILSILITTVAALITGVQPLPQSFSVTPDFSTLGDFDLGNVFSTLGLVAALLTIFSFMLTDFFDTMGTATGIAQQARLTDPDGRVPGVGRLLLVDSAGAALGGAAGISSNTSYIESAAGVAEGGRTGLTAVVVGVLFLVAILLSPLATLVPFVATGPVLVVVGYLMATLIRDIDFADLEEGFPALLTLILMPLTFNITIGIGAGFITWVLIKLALGKVGAIHPLMWVVAGAFVIFFAQALLPGGIAA